MGAFGLRAAVRAGRLLPFALAACGCDSITRPARPTPSDEIPELSAARKAEGEPGSQESSGGKPARIKKPWVHILPVDHGMRADRGGNGEFLAPRGHGQHNGVDLLAPIGTPLLAACGGKATSGLSPSFGRWVHLTCSVPEEFAGKRPLYASLFYAHLDSTPVRREGWATVERGQEVGKVGKSGNSRHEDIQPHVHFEVIVHDSLEAAQKERHFGRDQRNTRAADTFAHLLRRVCMWPNDFRSETGKVRRKRRLDPFVTLSCLSNEMPKFRPPEAPLDAFARSWQSHYRAKGFDVNQGRRAL